MRSQSPSSWVASTTIMMHSPGNTVRNVRQMPGSEAPMLTAADPASTPSAAPRNSSDAMAEAFHAAIYAGTHNAYLAEMTHATRSRVQPFRRAQFRNLGRLAKSHVEHDRVVLAILRGDRAGAAGAMRLHIMQVREEYEAYAETV